MLDLQPHEIESLADKLEETTLRAPRPPQLLPGTRYVVWAASGAVALVCVLLVAAVLRFPQVLEAVLRFRERRQYRRNVRRARRSLRRLLAEPLADDAFAARWQQIVRAYLGVRFGRSFESVIPARLESVLDAMTGGVPYDILEHAVEPLVSLFVRTDYVRFAGGSLDARELPQEEHSAAFLPGERESLVELTLRCMQDLESEEL